MPSGRRSASQTPSALTLLHLKRAAPSPSGGLPPSGHPSAAPFVVHLHPGFLVLSGRHAAAPGADGPSGQHDGRGPGHRVALPPASASSILDRTAPGAVPCRENAGSCPKPRNGERSSVPLPDGYKPSWPLAGTAGDWADDTWCPGWVAASRPPSRGGSCFLALDGSPCSGLNRGG